MEALKENAEPVSLWESLKWRVEGWRSGQSFADVAMRQRLLYRVEQLFLVHRETNQWLLHVAGDPAMAQDSAMAGAMLSEIQRFAADFLLTGYESRVEEFSRGDRQVWIAPGPRAYLAAVIRGTPPRELRSALEETLSHIHLEHAVPLAEFNGDASAFKAASGAMTSCLRAEYKRAPETPRSSGRWAASVAVFGIVLFGALLALRSQQHWQTFVTRLKAEPGILVGGAERHWFAPSRVVGLRDPRARNPAASREKRS